MKLLLASAATALAFGTSAFAAGHSDVISSYELGISDFYASNFIGMRVYASETDFSDATTVAAGAEGEWNDIGEINDMIITGDGTIEAVIVGVGGFLGLGEKNVALDMNSIRILTEDGNPSNRFLVVGANAAMLEEAPAFEGNIVRTEADVAETDAATTTDTMERPMLVAPAFEREGFAMVERDQLTAEELTGKRVYGVNDEDVGEVRDILMTAEGKVDRLVLDIGGFLGMGEHQIAVTPDELTFAREGDGAVNIYIDATQEALEAQPQFEG